MRIIIVKHHKASVDAGATEDAADDDDRDDDNNTCDNARHKPVSFLCQYQARGSARKGI